MPETYFYNAYRAKRDESKVWTTIHTNGAFVQHAHHHTEAEARRAVGKSGGNRDPKYRKGESRRVAAKA